MVTAVLAVPPAELATSKAPLTYIFQSFTGKSGTVISIIGLFAIINGALIQIIMASRVIYGLSSHGQLPSVLSFVHPKTQTPLLATVIATSVVLVLALIGHLSLLAESTAIIMLIIFSMVNLSLIRVKITQQKPEGATLFPFWVPVAGFIMSVCFVVSTLAKIIFT